MTPVVVGQRGIFCCKQLSTFCPVSVDKTAPIVKHKDPTPVPRLPRAAWHGAKLSIPTIDVVDPITVQRSGSAYKQVAHIGTCAWMQVRTFRPVKLDTKEPVKHPNASTVPNTPSAT
jgi:hypothetical protein